MSFKVLNLRFQILLGSMLCFVSPAIASEEGGHGNSSETIWRIINFAILVTALILIARYVKLKDFFANRKKNIIAELEDARKAKEEAEKKVEDFETQLVVIGKRIEAIHEEIREEGMIEKEKIIQEAKQMSIKIQEQAVFAIDQEIKKARIEIKKEIATVAVEMAEEILRSELTAADHEKLIKEYLEKVRLH